MGGVVASTANAGGNAGFQWATNSKGRYQVTTIGSEGSENLRVYDIQNNAERLRISSGGDVQVNGGALHLDASGELAVFETDTNLAFTNSAKLTFDFSGNVARIRTSGNGLSLIHISEPTRPY